ncbi:choice-of-anchor D domain-containing protein [Primorskyibacter flagellatus]|uniref:choice-of-anchor D domain-containing protein n=1 Tax=Primorskyibacter flagellatus TaxID=1387277 RepID=UPI003A914078
MTTLSAGDIAFIGYTGESVLSSLDDSFAFVLLRDVDASTVINITDSEYQAGVLRGDEGNIRWVSGTALTAGTVVSIAANANANTISASVGSASFDSNGGFFLNSFSSSTAGDQLIAFQGNAGAGETPIAALNTRPSGWDLAATGSDSQLPPGLTDGVDALHFIDTGVVDEFDNGYYNGPTSGTAEFLLAAINTASNWVGQNTAYPTSPFVTAFSISADLPPQEIAILGGANEIVDGDSTPTIVDGTVFGAVEVTGGNASRSYSVANQGGDPLNVSSIQITGAHASDFSVTTSPVGAIAGSSSALLTVQFNPSAGGARTATITVNSDDADEPSYSFDVYASGANPGSATTLAAGDIAFVGYNADQPDAFAFVLMTDVTAGTTIKFTDGGWTGTTFRSTEGAVQWTAPSDLSAGTVITYDDVSENGGLDFSEADTGYFTGSFDIGTSGDQIIAYQGTANVAGNASTNIAAIHFDSDTFDNVYVDGTGASLLPTGLVDGDTAISFGNGASEFDSGVWTPSAQATEDLLRQSLNNDSNWTGSDTPQTLPAGPYVPTGGPVAPEIDVLGNAVPIALGDSTPSWDDATIFSPVGVDDGGVTATYTIRNTGSGTLNIASVDVSGADAAQFSITSAPASSVAAGASTTVTVTFDPSAAGRQDATITVNSDDADESAYSFDISGTGIAAGGGTALSAGGAAIIGYNSTGADNFAFVLLNDVVAGTELRFTDGGWTGTTFRSGEGAGRWIAPTDLSAGTVITYDDLLTNGGEDFFPVLNAYFSGSFGPSSAGDQIMLYQGVADVTGASVSNVYALHFDATNFDTIYADTTGNSLVPTGLIDGVNAISLGENPVVSIPEYENGVYSGPTNLSFPALLLAISDETNWTLSHTVAQTLPSGPLGDTAPTVDVNTGLAVSEEASVTLTTAMLLATDAEGDTLTYTVTSLPAAGTLTLSGTPLAANDTFTQQDIIDGNVAWADGGAGILSTYDIVLSLSDGSNVQAVTVNVAVTLTDDVPQLAGLTPDLSVAEDTVVGLDLSQLDYSDEEDAINTLTIDAATGTFQSVADGAGLGVTEVLVDANTVTLSGTQAAINDYLNVAGNIQYLGQSDLSGDDADALSFAGFDGVNTTPLGSVAIDIVNDPELTLTIDQSSISENGGTATGTVTRDGATTDALIVTLGTDDPSETSVPATVTILAGNSSATFSVQGVDDAVLDGTQTATLSVSATGYTGDSETLDVTDDDVLTAVDDLFTFADTVTGVVAGLDVFAANPTLIDVFAPLGGVVTQVNGSALGVGADVSLGSGNTVNLGSDGQLTYTINADNEWLPVGDVLTETFTYQLGGLSTATVTLRIEGVDNDDLFTPTSGADTFDGGMGTNSISYAAVTAGVVVDLANSANNGGAALGDVLANFQIITGSTYDDVLSGSGGAEVINALSGNDVLQGRGAGDTLNGGDGLDWLSYADSAFGVTVDLGAGTATGGDAAGDSFTGIERVLGSAQSDTLTGSAEGDTLRGGGAGDSIVGGDGRDWADYRGAGGAVQIDLNAGTAAGAAGNDTLATIENLIGTGFADDLTGNSDANVLRGGLGADRLFGMAGADWADYRDSGVAVSVNLATGVTTGGTAAGDVFNSIENLLGSDGDDTLTGDTLVNVLRGGAGADVLTGTGEDWLDYRGSDAVTVNLLTATFLGGDAVGDTVSGLPNLLGTAEADSLTGDANDNIIRGGGGHDTMDGGAGFDWLDYRDASAAVMIDTGTSVAAGWATGDSFTGFEGVIGSDFADNLTGSNSAAVDEVFRGGLGADTLDGGLGIDWLDYRGGAGPVSVSLDAGVGTDGDAAGDVVSGFENLIGTGFGDTLEGDGNANLIRGGDGADEINGLGGDDTLMGQDGDDTFIFGAGSDDIYGGAGTDTLNVSGRNSADFTIVTNSATHVTMTDLTFGDVDELYYVESIVFADTTLLI